MCIIRLHCCVRVRVCVCVCAETLLPIRMALCSPSRLLLSSPSICARKMVASGVGLFLMSHILPWSLQEEEEEKNPSIQVNFSLYSLLLSSHSILMIFCLPDPVVGGRDLESARAERRISLHPSLYIVHQVEIRFSDHFQLSSVHHVPWQCILMVLYKKCNTMFF